MPLLNTNNEVAMFLSKIHNPIEGRIARYLIDSILAEGMLVSIQCEEGQDIDWVFVRDPLTCSHVGSFMLMYGNGEYLISDYSDNSFCNRHADKVYAKFW
jgi:hypothetical protein